MRVRIHIHIRIQLVWYGMACPGLVVSLAAVCFTGFNPKIKRELSIKICDPFRREVALQRRDADCCFKIKTSCALEKHTGKERRTASVGGGWVQKCTEKKKRGSASKIIRR